MSRRPNRRIMGPQSALTDFLATHHISAAQIRADADARRRAAQRNQDEPGEEQSDQVSAPPLAPEVTVAPSPALPTRTRGRAATEVTSREEKRKKEQKVIEKIKASKKFQKRKRDLDDSDDEDDLALAIFQERSAPLPGQMENCAVCGKRFTITPYSRGAPDGGLLCTPCGKELDQKGGAPKKKAKRASGGPVGKRRQMQSTILDGTYRPGAKSLMTLCIETLAKNIDLAEDLGDLPPLVIDKIARKLSKHRLLNPTTLHLFLQPSAEEVYIYDGAKLGATDYIKIFQTVPSLKRLKIRNGIHFKDEVMEYLASRNIDLEQLYLHGSNLLSQDRWKLYLEEKGKSLYSLRVYWTDKHFGDEVLSVLEASCPSLERLKVSHNQQVTGNGIKEIAKLKSLRHLSLDLRNQVRSDVYVSLLSEIGAGLETFSLSRVLDADNTVLDAIHNNCRSLRKLRITESDVMTDEGFVRLFKNWANRSLLFVDLEKCRQLEASHPRENPDNVGFCSNAFRALMAHSGRAIRHLNVHGCRHISESAFEDVFAPGKTYPELFKLEISFCEEVTDFIVGSIFRSCPNLRELNVFGCMKVRDVRVPRGKILVGVPTAVGMVIEGDDD
ncbi:RNI-like protein [Lasiosphaeria miniovina]|uniref:RNI-like protein n=1 Tax=Lasiosphaeria miniovina TaxID=1954250 RepID=A0AA40E409_9PEZI|nr:RNI-like protein [Lasiosphaeria miniovina]KAK0727234.1 RNI-like protein [Lasiosphaeria miniovina]